MLCDFLHFCISWEQKYLLPWWKIIFLRVSGWRTALEIRDSAFLRSTYAKHAFHRCNAAHCGYLMGFPGSASATEPTCQCRRRKRCGFGPWVGNIPLEEGMAIHSSILAWRIPMDRGAWQVTVDRVAKSWTWLSDLACTCMYLLALFETPQRTRGSGNRSKHWFSGSCSFLEQ